MTTYRINHPNGITVSSEDEDDDSVEYYEEGDEWEDPPEEVLAAFGDRLTEVDSDESVGVAERGAVAGPRGDGRAGEPVPEEELQDAEDLLDQDEEIPEEGDDAAETTGTTSAEGETGTGSRGGDSGNLNEAGDEPADTPSEENGAEPESDEEIAEEVDGDVEEEDVGDIDKAPELHWQTLKQMIKSGGFDDKLDELRETEENRENGPRTSILKAIDKRERKQ